MKKRKRKENRRERERERKMKLAKCKSNKISAVSTSQQGPTRNKLVS
jgi:hypothetical protein